jgi:phage terminase large subunit
MPITSHLLSKDPYLYYPKNKITSKICLRSEDGRHRFLPPALNCADCGLGSVIVNREVLYVPTEKGMEYHQREEANVLLWGGRGSAKSTTGRWDAHLRALANPGYKYVILRKTFPELEKSHLIFVPREMSLLGGTYNQTFHKAFYPNGSIGFFSHCATDKDVLNLLSSEFALMFFDEISTFDWEQVTKLAASVRAPVGSGYVPMMRAATNPLGPSMLKLIEYFVDKNVDPEEDPDYNPNDWYSIKANLVDNPYLDKEQYSKRFAGLPPHVRKAWVEGEFAYENAMFDFHPLGDGKEHGEAGKPFHVIQDIDLPKVLANATVYRAIDAGWFPDPTVCLWIAHLGNRHIVFHEQTWYKTTYTQIVADIKAAERSLGVKKVAMTYCDPSMNLNTTADVKTLMEAYESEGIAMEPSINNREYFATALHTALAELAYEGTPRLQIYHRGKQGCPMLVKTIPQMRFDENRPKAMGDHKNDHWVVSLAYYLMSHSSDLRGEDGEGGGPVVLRPWMKDKAHKKFTLGSDQVRG